MTNHGYFYIFAPLMVVYIFSLFTSLSIENCVIFSPHFHKLVIRDYLQLDACGGNSVLIELLG